MAQKRQCKEVSMSVTKESNGKWTAQCWVKDWTGKRHHRKKRGFLTKRDALGWERTQLMQTSPVNLLFGDFVEIYYEDKKNEMKPRTMYNKKTMVQRHLLPYFKNKLICEITSQDVLRWQDAIIGKGYAEAYKRQIQNQLTAIMNHAVRLYHLPENPCGKVQRMGKHVNAKMDFWTKEEYDEFISHLDRGGRYHMIFELLFWTGMREGEMLALAPEDIDLERLQIHISKSYYRIERKTHITSPKTPTSIRTIDIPQFLADELKEYMGRIYDLQPGDRLFPIVQESVQHKLKKVIEQYGLKKIRVHDFRHSHVAYLIHQGVQPLVIKERLGHNDIRMTMNTYGHLYPSQQREIAEMLNRQRKGESNDK